MASHEVVRDELKALFKMNNIELARNLKNRIIDPYRNQVARMVECLVEGFEDSFRPVQLKKGMTQDLKTPIGLKDLILKSEEAEKWCVYFQVNNQYFV